MPPSLNLVFLRIWATVSGKLRVVIFAFFEGIIFFSCFLLYKMQCVILNFLPGNSIKLFEVYKWECWCNLLILNWHETCLKAPDFKMAAFGSNKYFFGLEYVA